MADEKMVWIQKKDLPGTEPKQVNRIAFENAWRDRGFEEVPAPTGDAPVATTAATSSGGEKPDGGSPAAAS